MTARGRRVVWITGATRGLGSSLAALVPWRDAHVVNVSRSSRSDVENVRADLSDPRSWADVAEHFGQTLRSGPVDAAYLVLNAVATEGAAGVGSATAEAHRAAVLANVAAPVVLGEAFVRACAASGSPGMASGVLAISSEVAVEPLSGFSVYGAGKAAVEQWVRTLQVERRAAGSATWAAAVRPLYVDTPAFRRSRGSAGDGDPLGAFIRELYERGEVCSPDEVAREIWDLFDRLPETEHVVKVGRTDRRDG